MQFSRLVLALLLSVYCSTYVSAQHEGHDHSGHNHEAHTEEHHDQQDGHGHDDHSAHEGGHHKFDPKETAFHHISDANVYSIGPFNIPLPCFLYAPGEGFTVLSSGRFEPDYHGTGSIAVNGYTLSMGSVIKVLDEGFPEGEVAIDNIIHKQEENVAGKIGTVDYVVYKGKEYKAFPKSTADGGVLGGGITNFYDFSITKNVVSMLLVCALLFFVFVRAAKRYRERPGQAPSGIQNFLEPIFLFVQDEVAKPFLGKHWERFTPFLMTIFFFILGLNLFGQIPFFGGANVTGNIAITAVLAVIAFLVTNINGSSYYWQHTLLAVGTPWFVKLILIPVEILGLFIKPITLMLRLFANITAGHMVIIIFVSFIFIFGQSGQNVPGAGMGVVASTLLTMFMMAIELIVAFVQAFVFTILTASYIGAAKEEHHH